jgi:ribosomal protein L20
LKLANIDLDRKTLAELAVYDPEAFAQLVILSKAQKPTVPTA